MPVFGQKFSQIPASPQAGEIVRIEIDLSKSKLGHAAELEWVVLEYTNGKVVAAEVANLRTPNKFVGVFTLSVGAQSAVAALRSDDELWDNNNGEGYFITVHSPSGKIEPENIMAAAILYRDYGGLLNLNRMPSVAMGLAEQAVAAKPELKRRFFTFYANCLISIKKTEEARTEAMNLAMAIESDQNASEDELLATSRLYERNGELDRSKNVKEKIRLRYPSGNLVQQEKRRAVQNESDLTRAEQLLADFAKQFPPKNDEETEALNQLRTNLAGKLADAGQWDACRAQASLMSEHARAALYNNLAWELAEKGENMEEARILAATAYEWAKKEWLHPRAPKSPYTTMAQWAEQRENTFAMYADTYAFVMSKSGDPFSAANIQAEAVAATKDKELEMNERYAQYLEASGSPELRQRLENFILNGHATAKMKEQFKKAYAAEERGDSGAATYLAKLEKRAKASKRKALEGKILDEQAVPFSLTNLEGKTVSLESLRGKVVVIDFWATWCGPCKASFPGMQLAVNQHKDDADVAFVFIDSWERGADKAKNAADFIASKGYNFNVLLDLEDKVVASYNVSGIPTKYIIDKKGRIRFKSVGFEGSDEGLAEELALMIEVAKAL